MLITLEGLTSTKAARLDQLRQRDPDKTPQENTSHNETEKRCNKCVEDFQDRFLESFPHLKERLFLFPRNEYGTAKFVSTYLQPTLLPHTELYDLTVCTRFVANYLSYEPLEDALDGSPSVEIALVSPAQTLAWTVGDCFDCSLLLASLLIGSGHDAFVVFGSAPEWVRLKDQRHHIAMMTNDGEKNDDVSTPCNGRPMMVQDDCSNRPESGSDQSVHCWVLVKGSRKRDIESEAIFIEPSTGLVYPIGPNCPYSQVFSIWNHSNCWVNTGEGSTEMIGADFANEPWLPVLPDSTSAPFSWVNALNLPKEKFLLRYPPDGKRTINIHKAKIEMFGDKVDLEGVATRIVQYKDEARMIVEKCTELFCPTERKDNMLQRIRTPLDNTIHENFSPKSELLERTETVGMRTMKFHAKTRADGLVERSEVLGSPGFPRQSEDDVVSREPIRLTITEHFTNRHDGLFRRKVVLSPVSSRLCSREIDVKKNKIPHSVPMDRGMGLAVVERIDEYYSKPSPCVSLENSVSSRSFLLKERMVKIAYHCEHEVLRREEVFSTNNDSNESKELSQLENESLASVKRVQTEMIGLNESNFRQEVKDFVGDEHSTISTLPLTIQTKKDEDSTVIDYLSPYLYAFERKHLYLSKEEAARVRSSCLEDFKGRMLERGQLIQKRLHNERQRLSEEEYQDKVESIESDCKFQIGLLEQRLAEHEEKAIKKYKALEEKLDSDARLAALFEG